MANEEKWLFLVDTNVFLDFYRYPGEPAKRQLDGLLKHKQSLIVTEQLHMEYLKNRQKVIAENLKKSLGVDRLGSLPSLLADSKFGRATAKADRALDVRMRKLRSYADNVLVKPGAYDSVYKTAVKIFRSEHAWNLKRPNKLRYEIRESAQRRFSLGYPPRKAADTSIGDAINWEWIIHCATNAAHTPNILIVSRDGDFGVTQGKTTVLNDWLKWEFKNRVKGRRRIELTTKLTDALRKLDEQVTLKDEEIENQVIDSWKNEPDVRLSDLSPDNAFLNYLRYYEKLKAPLDFERKFADPSAVE
ncbi:MAG: PIN domain-containing protein [Pseudomonadota bacterium]|nr:PIN domain-containing protein [Pseudomonadota bacterium]